MGATARLTVDAVDVAEDGVDRLQLDPVAAQLHLVVDTTEEHARRLRVPHPILDNEELAALKVIKVQVKLQKVKVDDEHVIWPFTGEYWKDELGYYRFQVRNKCAAASK